MKKKKVAQKSLFSVTGYLLFFLLVAGIATCSILAYSFVFDKSGGNKATTAIVTLIILLVLALICTIVDFFRRKIAVELPVQKIVEATEKITAGDFTVKLVPLHTFGKYNEFDIIIENINRMTLELQKNEVLKTDFIANISHEIKTPLALIQNYAIGLGNDNLPLTTKKEYANTLLNASKRLSDLITNILKLNKLENQEIFPDKIRFDLGEQLRECVLGFDEKFEQKELEVSCNIDDVEVISDPVFLDIIWNNLLSNAVKFTNINGKISINLKKIKDYAEISVADSGCGISKDIGFRIFDKFYQGDTSHATEGNGLGLALVKRVIDILGGEIAVESKEGKGSIFTIKLKTGML